MSDDLKAKALTGLHLLLLAATALVVFFPNARVGVWKFVFLVPLIAASGVHTIRAVRKGHLKKTPNELFNEAASRGLQVSSSALERWSIPISWIGIIAILFG